MWKVRDYNTIVTARHRANKGGKERKLIFVTIYKWKVTLARTRLM